jgi:hypothetical protein
MIYKNACNISKSPRSGTVPHMEKNLVNSVNPVKHFVFSESDYERGRPHTEDHWLCL